ncbi:hypothetical protein PYCCODRAFT_1145209 [Trametes coccinea BRFM310]|uniref:Protein kinase domain-containing protein n=1 Tax=Trametes coccinea (strain BRFM310) TaxID=1353009 RepID=A0A1Y2I869_TRAC3|nr:hypothetical protein PYCCODRAFT_1145209 [Trametes coccinea BRFM310]
MSQQQCVYNVPMALDLDSSRTAGLDPLLALARNQGHIYDIQRCTVAPMPHPDFIETFFPQTKNRSACLSYRNAFSGVPSRADSVVKIYNPLISALNKRTKFKSRCPGFVFMPTSEHSIRPQRLGYAKPHICCVKAENAFHIQNAHPGSRVEFGYAELFIHVMADPTDDFFVDPAPPERLAEYHEFVRSFDDEVNEENFEDIQARYKALARAHGLHVAFAVEVFARQQRLFLFTISVAGSMARFYRWDRSGCVVSRAFDIRQNPYRLTEFLWRFSSVSDAGRGHDRTVRMASAAEEALFRGVVRNYLAAQLEGTEHNLDKALSAHYCPGHVTALSVTPHASETTGETTFIVSRPVISPLALDGRSTRGYWAVNSASGQIGFLKDTWRTCSQKEIEGDVLRGLNDLGVRNVPILAFHGDVADSRRVDSSDPGFQETQTNRFYNMSWAGRMRGKIIHVSRRRHYRLVTHTVGQSLKTLRGTEELLHSTYDVFIAMRDALAKDSRIHRDLSVGNIILVKESDRAIRKGYLIDWDASDRIDEAGESLRPGRAGTWAFSSIRVLRGAFQEENGKHTFKDDMEALIYVVLYCALLYLPHDLHPRDLTDLYRDFFNQRDDIEGLELGGQGKTANARYRNFTRSIHFGSTAYKEWLTTVLDYHTPHRVPIGQGEMWEAETLDTYWSQFLKTHTLERDDRAVHRLVTFDRWDPDSPSSEPAPMPSSHLVQILVDAVPPSPGAAMAGRRRKRSTSADRAPVLPSKRSKRARPGPSSRPVDSPVRRSSRIREQRIRKDASAAAVASTARHATLHYTSDQRVLDASSVRRN